ncbi:MAG: hypothetical protein IPM55_15395 [Acidobacteria bacterium]|nr:hypothetical protein [Acidobacteriota bacterium]
MRLQFIWNRNFHGHHFPAGFSEMIYEKTEGHPLFMADLVTYLRDRHIIAEEKGLQDAGSSWVLSKTLSDIEGMLPKSVCGMIKCKIRQLDDMDRKLLVAASVQDCAFDSAVVAKVLNIEIDKVEERLLRLERDHSLVKLTAEYELADGTPDAAISFCSYVVSKCNVEIAEGIAKSRPESSRGADDCGFVRRAFGGHGE